MSVLGQDIATLLARELQGFQRELELFPDDASIWATVPGVTNSGANLALHVAGNVQHYVGAVLGHSGYVRNRPDEFERRTGTRQQLIDELDAAERAVRDVLPTLGDDRLDLPCPDPDAEDQGVITRRFLLHLCTHASFHLGQAGYVRRISTGNGTSSGALSRRLLTDADGS